MEVGVDITKIDRFNNLVDNQTFLTKNFNKCEIDYILLKKVKSVERLAGLFCCKESVLKAFGVGIGNGINLKDICVLHDNNGKPCVEINDVIKSYLNKNNCNNIRVSISHDGEYAISECIIF